MTPPGDEPEDDDRAETSDASGARSISKPTPDTSPDADAPPRADAPPSSTANTADGPEGAPSAAPAWGNAATDISLPPSRARTRLLLASVLVVATCGLVYELISATMASYLLGDSVTQWSLVIGVYLSAMGLGSWLSKYLVRHLPTRFVQVQLIIALVGGFSATALFFGFAHLSSVRPLLFGILVVVGTMVGLEIPLLMRLLGPGVDLKDLVARVLAFDYLGALAASILFPLALLPYLGLVRTALLFGVFNAAVALWSARAFADAVVRPRWLTTQAAVVLAVLAGSLGFGKHIEEFGENQLYDFPVVFSEKTPYQRLTITRWQGDLRLYIDGNLQFSSMDEHRYHEALVHPAMAAADERQPASRGRRVLVLGGGDGLAVREILRHERVASVDLVDLDPRMTELFSDHPVLSGLSQGSLRDERVTVHNADAMEWLGTHAAQGEAPFDVAIVDLPDPNNFSLGKLYTRSFYRLLRSRLAADGVAVVQSTSPYFAPRAFWCIVATLRAAGLNPRPFHAYVPSFGDWGFNLIAPTPGPVPRRLTAGIAMRFLTDATMAAMFEFPADQQPADVEINRLNDQLLVHYYEEDLIDPLGLGGPRGARPGAAGS